MNKASLLKQPNGLVYSNEFSYVFFGNKKYSETEFFLHKDKIQFVRQNHGTEIASLTDFKNLQGSSTSLEHFDGLNTKQKNTKVGLYTADCVPLFLISNFEIYALHLGWRGLTSGLLDKALSKLLKPQETFAYIGPHIRRASFQVKEDVLQVFQSIEPQADIWHKQSEHGEHFVSMEAVIKSKLKMYDLTKVLSANADTCSDLNYHSYRRDKHQALRNISFAFLK